MPEDREILADFVLESREHLAAIESGILTLERDPSAVEALQSAFRAFHTIKGMAGFLNLPLVLEVSHEVEAILDGARNFQLSITPAVIDVILQAADYLRGWVSHVEAKLKHLPTSAPPCDERLLGRIRWCALASSSEPAGIAESGGRPVAVAAAVDAMAIRVDTGKLDALVDIVGELVIAESIVRGDPDPSLQRKIAQITRITAELQKTAMAMRLVPIGQLFRRMERLVRDLSREFGKPAEMETGGGQIELDRTIVKELADPLMHMVRNALDHGIESPAERKERGKPPVARLLLKAQHKAGKVVIEISDDGRGLDCEKLRARAVERGLIAEGGAISDSDVYNLIFEPGFSTAARVTSVSGRGVGMDVVREHVERLRGRIEIRSAPGAGTRFILKLPLTLAIIDGLVVGVGTERYILPVLAVREMLRPSEGTMWSIQQSGETALVRGSLIPVMRLYRKFRLLPRSEDPLQSVLVVVEVEDQRFGILVDELIGKQEVVIKSLGAAFLNVSGVAGGAILGDGRVGLILDLDRLWKVRNGN